MFRGLLFVRLKAAEQALRDGRIDDAFRMACEPDLSGHARGARLLAALGKAFVERARTHFRAERFTEALLDLGKADRCGGAEAAVAELRNQVTTVAQEVARQVGDRRRRVEEARRCLQAGSIAAGKRLVDSATEDAELQELKKDMAQRETRSEELLAQAVSLFQQNRIESAVERLGRSKQLNTHNERATQLEAQICDQVIMQVRQSFQAGRLNRARAELAPLDSLSQRRSERTELAELLEAAAAAGRALEAGRFDEARRLVMRLLGLDPKGAWLRQAADQLTKLDDALMALRSGPLGEPPPDPGHGLEQLPQERGASALQETVALPPHSPPPPVASLPTQLLLLVDGGGSYLLHRGDRATIGRAATTNPADIAIFSDLSERHADVARVEDDYFLLSPHDVDVAGRPVRHQLLHDGDRIVLGRRAKFTFRVPDRKSASARMDISDSTKMPNDVRCVVLFKDTATIGRGPTCHVTCHAAQRELVLFERGARLWIRPQGRGGRDAEARPIELGETIEMEGMSFVVREPASGVHI